MWWLREGEWEVYGMSRVRGCDCGCLGIKSGGLIDGGEGGAGWRVLLKFADGDSERWAEC